MNEKWSINKKIWQDSNDVKQPKKKKFGSLKTYVTILDDEVNKKSKFLSFIYDVLVPCSCMLWVHFKNFDKKLFL